LNCSNLRTAHKVFIGHFATPCPSSSWLDDHMLMTSEHLERILNVDLQNEDHLVWAKLFPNEKDLAELGNFLVSWMN
jgi:hypothetical protein